MPSGPLAVVVHSEGVIELSALPLPEFIREYGPGQAYKLVRVAQTDTPILEALEDFWSRVRAEDPRVPAVTFSLQPGRPSSCNSVEWDSDPVLVINLMPDGTKLPGADVAAWLLHMASHAAAGPAKGMEGRYHGAEYKAAAEALGLSVERGSTGWGQTSLARGAKTRYRAEIAELDRALGRWNPFVARKRGRGQGKYVCECPEPRTIRVHAGVMAKGAVFCSVCGQKFRPG
jgi:hypothetical protein